MNTEATTASDAAASIGNSDALVGMATLGKTAAALALVVVLIFLCAAFLKRWLRHGAYPNLKLDVIGSTAVGNRERVVIVEVEGTWLVLGVGNGQVTKLHELPAQERPKPSSSDRPPIPRFSERLAQALNKQRKNDSMSASSDPDVTS